jgi:hypothetical protein
MFESAPSYDWDLRTQSAQQSQWKKGRERRKINPYGIQCNGNRIMPEEQEQKVLRKLLILSEFDCSFIENFYQD